MKDIIHLLPDSVANQIAAGEVIQRPSSCLKELVENSLDAGASHIQINIVEAGRTLLQVVDDGCGMSQTDARMAFERHATSKIQDANDLYNLKTMGFRGEALASICAVAHIELTTRRAEDEMGTTLEIAGSEVLKQEVCMCPVGTNFKVKNLFYNIPVRRKFLKSNQTELRNLIQEFYRIALIYNEIAFTFVVDDEIYFELKKQSRKERIEKIFGGKNKNYTQALLPLDVETGLVNISGFIENPENASKIAQQYFFVNGRYMRHPYFHKTLMNAYNKMLQPEQNPSYFVYFDVNRQDIDVNIHPTKTEIKFENEQDIAQILNATAREILGKFNVVSTINFDRPNVPLEQIIAPQPSAQPKIIIDKTYSPFKSRNTYRTDNQNFIYQNNEQSTIEESWTTFEMDFNRAVQHQGYIYVPIHAGMLLIDQHRAHLCCLYAQFLEQLTDTPAQAQTLLFPTTIEVHKHEVEMLKSILPELHDVGFNITQTDDTLFTVSAIPPNSKESMTKEILQNILDNIDISAPSLLDNQKTIALALARTLAIERNKVLANDEIETLLNNLFHLPAFQYTPDGKKVLQVLPTPNF